MKYAVLALALCAVTYAASDAGKFVPRSVYTLDSEGHQSNVQPVNDRLLRRLRRQTFSSSSHTSSSTSGDGTYHSTSSQTFQNDDGSTYTQGNIQHIVQPPVVLSQRFGDDSPSSSYGAQAPQGVSYTFTQSQDPSGNTKIQETQANLANGQWKVNQTNFVYPKN